MKYGIRNGMLGEQLDKEFFVAKELGLDGIEFCIGGNYKSELLWTDGGIDKLKGLADKSGVEVCSLSPGVFAGLHPALPDEAKRAEGIEMMKYCIEVCSPLGTKWILTPMFPNDVDKWTDDTWNMLVEGFKAIMETAEKHKVILGLESTFTADHLLKIIDKVGSECLKAYYDVANMTHWGQNPVEEIRKLGKQICMIHVKDTENKMLGEGKVDFKGVSDAIRDIGYDDYMVLETPGGFRSNKLSLYEEARQVISPSLFFRIANLTTSVFNKKDSSLRSE
jgi:sugar phosphate isomerase/epimerase